jgi:L,D-transpeptidase catalytic domain
MLWLRFATLGAIILATLAGGHAVAAGVASPRGPGPPAADQVLSNERTFTRWAQVEQIAPIYARPTTHSTRISRLHGETEDGFPETYLLLRVHSDSQGREWIRLRIPGRPNGRTGWVLGYDLGAFHLTHTLITVDRARLRIYLSEHGRRIWSAPVAVGKPSTPTPPGHFWIRERIKIDDPNSGYWPYAFGTSDYSTLTDWPGGGVVGIHGPYYEPWAIPGTVSHGCIRLRSSDDAWLAGHIGVGTPVRIL